MQEPTRIGDLGCGNSNGTKLGNEIRSLAFDFKAGVPATKAARESFDRIYGDGEKETN